MRKRHDGPELGSLLKNLVLKPKPSDASDPEVPVTPHVVAAARGTSVVMTPARCDRTVRTREADLVPPEEAPMLGEVKEEACAEPAMEEEPEEMMQMPPPLIERSRSPPRDRGLGRRLHGSVVQHINKNAPVKFDAWTSRAPANKTVPGLMVAPAEVWERAVDEKRNAVYFWEHVTQKASWDPPPNHLGWWERVQDQTNRLEFFWNSATQITVWHLPLNDTLPSAGGQLALPALPWADPKEETEVV
mmetsp:Transcript_116171/g.276092  ORF Transcript_116171/g.276092 Transcript_116171/m.276092 type:complete len:246 (+) Transcript_116171:63-800(+)